MNRILFSIALVLALCIPTWATYASPHIPAHEAPQPTKEWVFEDYIQTSSNHRVLTGIERLIPSAVAVVCPERMRVELSIPIDEFPGVASIAHVTTTKSTDGEFIAYFSAENSFGGFDFSQMFFRLRDPDDRTKQFAGSICKAYWYYDIPLQEQTSKQFKLPGCLNAWSDFCV